MGFMLRLFIIRSPRFIMSQRVIVIIKDPFGHLYHYFCIWKISRRLPRTKLANLHNVGLVMDVWALRKTIKVKELGLLGHTFDDHSSWIRLEVEEECEGPRKERKARKKNEEALEEVEGPNLHVPPHICKKHRDFGYTWGLKITR